MAVGDKFIATLGERGDQVRAVIIERRIDDARYRQCELIEQIETAPCSHAQGVLAPCVIQYVWLRHHWTDGRAKSFAERKVFDVETDVDGEAGTVGPAIHGAAADRRIIKAPVAGQRAICGRIHGAVSCRTARTPVFTSGPIVRKPKSPHRACCEQTLVRARIEAAACYVTRRTAISG